MYIRWIKTTDDIWIYDFVCCEWRKSLVKVPMPIAGCTAIVAHDKRTIHIIGGRDTWGKSLKIHWIIDVKYIFPPIEWVIQFWARCHCMVVNRDVIETIILFYNSRVCSPV